MAHEHHAFFICVAYDFLCMIIMRHSFQLILMHIFKHYNHMKKSWLSCVVLYYCVLHHITLPGSIDVSQVHIWVIFLKDFCTHFFQFKFSLKPDLYIFSFLLNIFMPFFNFQDHNYMYHFRQVIYLMCHDSLWDNFISDKFSICVIFNCIFYKGSYVFKTPWEFVSELITIWTDCSGGLVVERLTCTWETGVWIPVESYLRLKN